MAYYKITENKKGQLVAKVQAYGANSENGEKKLYVKRIYNENNLSEAKFRKFVDKEAIAFEEELIRKYNNGVSNRTKILTFSELMSEWKESIKANLSICYYDRVSDVEKKFNTYLDEQHLSHLQISEITVRDVQKFLDGFSKKQYLHSNRATLIKKLPDNVNFRELAREKILSRNASYYMKKGMCRISIDKAISICEKYNLTIDEFFDTSNNKKQYSVETIKGFRRVLRTLFNEAVRFEWITQNPVCKTKVTAGSNNTYLREVAEKEVYSVLEAQELLRALSKELPNTPNRAILVKIMLLTGMRNAEIHGLKWCDIDFDKKLIHVRRNRIYTDGFGVYEKCPKTKTSVRDIPIPDSLIADLNDYQEWFRLADKDFDNKLDQYYLAVDIRREPINPTSLSSWLTRFERSHGFKHVSCHGLRHTYCSLLLSSNVPIQTVSKYLGHSDSSITLEVYSHFIPDTQSRVLTVLDGLTK